MRLGTWLAQRDGIQNEALDGKKEVQLEENYLHQQPETMDLKIKMVKIMEKGNIVWRPFVVQTTTASLLNLTNECRSYIMVIRLRLRYVNNIHKSSISYLQWYFRFQGYQRVRDQLSCPLSSHGKNGNKRRN